MKYARALLFATLAGVTIVGTTGCAVGRGGLDLLCGGGDLAHLNREGVYLEEVGAHPLHHDALLDVDHVRMSNAVVIDDVGHLHAAV